MTYLLWAESNQDLQEVMSAVSREAKALGMKINTDKTEVQW